MAPQTTRYKELLARYLRPHRRLVIVVAALLLGNIALQLVNPQILRYFIDAAESGATTRVLTWAALLYILVALLYQALSVGASYASEKLGWLATNALREDLALHCLELDMGFHNRKTPGELIERIDGDIANLANFFAEFIIRVLGSLLLLAGILVILFIEDWRIGAALSAYAAFTLFVLLKLRNIAVPFWKTARQASAEQYGFIEEHLNGTEDIRASGAVPFALNGFYRHAGKRLQLERRAGIMNIWLRIASRATRALGLIVALGIGYYLFQQDAITTGTVFMVVHYANSLFRPLERLTRQMEDLQQASASIERLDELYNTPNSLKDGPGADFAPGPLALEFDQVTFGYNPEEPVLRQLSFQLKPGQVMGLLGRTGSGKTTIARLIYRLYDIQQGSITLNGTDLRQAQIEQLRRPVGMVTQTVQLFRASVRDNLTFFDASIPDQRIIQVLEAVELQEWFLGLSAGLDTQLAGGGKGLSAGEAQLLTFARVFLQNPGLVILDEASSRLDPATESRIERAVDRLLENRTGIIIAHRLPTVQRADHILILAEGQIQEWGQRQALAKNPQSRFAQLLRTGLEEVLA